MKSYSALILSCDARASALEFPGESSLGLVLKKLNAGGGNGCQKKTYSFIINDGRSRKMYIRLEQKKTDSFRILESFHFKFLSWVYCVFPVSLSCIIISASSSFTWQFRKLFTLHRTVVILMLEMTLHTSSTIHSSNFKFQSRFPKLLADSEHNPPRLTLNVLDHSFK